MRSELLQTESDTLLLIVEIKDNNVELLVEFNHFLRIAYGAQLVDGDRYACVKVEVSGEKPVRYELGMVGNEDLDEELGEDEYFGFGVDAGMGCVADIQTQAAFKTYWAKRLEEDPDIDPYNDLFCDLLEENAKAHPKYQGDCGDWLNWTVPDTDCNLPIFASGWGDGYYPVYFGYDAKGEVCAVYVRFIDIEASYQAIRN